MTGKITTAARRTVLAAALAGIIAGLGGCSSVPDAVNPVSWYRGVRDAVSGDDSKPADATAQNAASAQAIPGADKPFPSLGTVPERPETLSTAADRAQAARSLAADREQARYSDQEIRRQTDDQGNRPRRPAPAAATTESPAPAAAPASRPPAPPRVAPPSPPPATASAANAAPPPPTPPPGPSTGPWSAASPPAAAPAPRPAPPPPQIPAEPPPPPTILDTSPRAAPPPQQPQPVSPSQAAPTASRPEASPSAAPVPLVFGPPPADIAGPAGNGRGRGGTAPAPRSQTGRFAPIPTAPAGAMPASRYSARFPPGVQFTPEAGVRSGGRKLATIYFADGSSALGRGDRATIRRAVDAFRAGGGTIRVVGHASSRTRDLAPARHEMANFAISLDRANAVAREIVRLGVDPSVVQVSAVSDMEPAYQEGMPAGEAGNRRAEILIGN